MLLAASASTPVVFADKPPVITCLYETLSSYTGQVVLDGIGGADPDGFIKLAVVNFGDGATASASVSNALGPGWCNPSGSWVVTPTFAAIFAHTYTTAGSYAVTMYLIDNANLASTESFTITMTSTSSDGSGGGGGGMCHPCRI